MNMAVGALVFVPLLAISIACLVWALGGSWPIRDKAQMARIVVGRPGATRVPRLAALGVFVFAFAAGILGLSLADHDSGGLPLTLIGLVLAAIFIARGVLGYTAGWRARYSEEPFATLDRRNYSPLALIIGAGFLVLVVMRLL